METDSKVLNDERTEKAIARSSRHFYAALSVVFLATNAAAFGWHWQVGCLLLALWASLYAIAAAVLRAIAEHISVTVCNVLMKDYMAGKAGRKTSGRI